MYIRLKITRISLALAVLAAFLAAGLMAACGGADYGSQPDSSQAPAALNNPFGIYSPGNLDAVPADSRQRILELLGMDYNGFQELNFDIMNEAGVGWVRVDFEYDAGFKEPLDYLARVEASGLEIVGCARPIRGFEINDANLASFEADFRDLVKRYPWIHTWQIGNEPNIALANPDEYPRMFVAGDRAVREVCPSCRVMLAGIALRYPNNAMAKEYSRRMLASLATQTSGDKPFDIFDIHFYGLAQDYGMLPGNIADYRGFLRDNGFSGEIEMWMTETATYSGKPIQPASALVQTEEQQAAELVRRFVASLGNGVSRVSWSRPYENWRYNGNSEDGFYDLTALVYNGLGQEAASGIEAGTRKKAWYAYKTLISRVEGYEEARELETGLYQFSFCCGRPAVFVLWNVGLGASPQKSLPLRGQVRLTDLMGNETVADAGTLVAGESPVFIQAGGPGQE